MSFAVVLGIVPCIAAEVIEDGDDILSSELVSQCEGVSVHARTVPLHPINLNIENLFSHSIH